MTEASQFHRFKIVAPQFRAYQPGTRLEVPRTDAELNTAITAVQITARACALHDAGATITHLAARPDHRVGIGCGPGTVNFDTARYGHDLMRDPITVEAARTYLAVLAADWAGAIDRAAERIPAHDPSQHAEAAAYVQAQWDRITGFAQQLVRHGSAMNDPVMPPPPGPAFR